MKQILEVKVRVNTRIKEHQIPRYPQFIYSKTLRSNSWIAKDMQTGEELKVEKVLKGDFIFYKIEYLTKQTD